MATFWWSPSASTQLDLDLGVPFHGSTPVRSSPSPLWWSAKSTHGALGAQWHSTPCAAASCACTLPWACQRSKVCAWRIWSQSLVLERQLLRRDLQRLEL